MKNCGEWCGGGSFFDCATDHAFNARGVLLMGFTGNSKLRIL